MSDPSDAELVGIFNAGCAAGRDDTGVYAVWMAGKGTPVTRVVNVGRSAYEYQGKMGSVAEWFPDFASVYATYKEELSKGPVAALRAVYGLEGKFP